MLKIATDGTRFSPAFKLGEALRSDVARGSQKNVVKIVPKTRDFTVVFVPLFGHFRPDFNIRAQDRVRGPALSTL